MRTDWSAYARLFKAKPDKRRLNVLFFPQAGGDTSLYNRWQPALAPHIQVMPVQLPGRGVRLGEAGPDNMDQVMDLLLPAMPAFEGAPYILFGSSMGGWIAYELYLRLMAAGLTGPEALFICASNDPYAERRLPDLEGRDRAQQVAALTAFNPGFAEIAASEELLDLLLPTIQSDFRICRNYRPSSREKLRIPLHAFAGEADQIVPMENMTGWQPLTSGPYHLDQVPGDHFFIEEKPAQICERLIRHAGALALS